MQAGSVSLVGQRFSLGICSANREKKSRCKKSKEERRELVESFILNYRSSNNGKFPSLNLTHKEVGGSFYIVREILRDIIQENRVLAPGDVNSRVLSFDDCPDVQEHSAFTGINDDSINVPAIGQDPEVSWPKMADYNYISTEQLLQSSNLLGPGFLINVHNATSAPEVSTDHADRLSVSCDSLTEDISDGSDEANPSLPHDDSDLIIKGIQMGDCSFDTSHVSSNRSQLSETNWASTSLDGTNSSEMNFGPHASGKIAADEAVNSPESTHDVNFVAHGGDISHRTTVHSQTNGALDLHDDVVSSEGASAELVVEDMHLGVNGLSSDDRPLEAYDLSSSAESSTARDSEFMPDDSHNGTTNNDVSEPISSHADEFSDASETVIPEAVSSDSLMVKDALSDETGTASTDDFFRILHGANLTRKIEGNISISRCSSGREPESFVVKGRISVGNFKAAEKMPNSIIELNGMNGKGLAQTQLKEIRDISRQTSTSPNPSVPHSSQEEPTEDSAGDKMSLTDGDEGSTRGADGEKEATPATESAESIPLWSMLKSFVQAMIKFWS